MAEANSEQSEGAYRKVPLFRDTAEKQSEAASFPAVKTAGSQSGEVVKSSSPFLPQEDDHDEYFKPPTAADWRRFNEAMGRGAKPRNVGGSSLDDIAKQRDELTGETPIERADRMPSPGQELGSALPAESVVSRAKVIKEGK